MRMTYAPAGRTIYDADSHIMELPNFIIDYADEEFKALIPPVSYSASLVTDEEIDEILANGGQHSDAHRAEQIALGDDLIKTSKEIQGLGAFNREDRSTAMDMLGFAKQLIFATHSLKFPFSIKTDIDPKLRYGAARGHNRAMADFCAKDDRLMGVGAIPTHDIDLAMEELEFALGAGLKAMWIPHYAAGDRSPGHLDMDPFWARLAETGTPFVMHVGGAPLQMDPRWNNNGRAPAKDWMGGGENLRAKDMVVLHHAPETFVSMMVLDGVFERHPTLRGAAVELGASWVPEMLTRLDRIVHSWSRVDESLQGMKRLPSEQLRDQMAFTPFVFEDVGQYIDQTGPEFYLFSSDYPHVEGGKDPIARFERSLNDRSEGVRDAFYSENFLRIFPDARVG